MIEKDHNNKNLIYGGIVVEDDYTEILSDPLISLENCSIRKDRSKIDGLSHKALDDGKLNEYLKLREACAAIDREIHEYRMHRLEEVERGSTIFKNVCLGLATLGSFIYAVWDDTSERPSVMRCTTRILEKMSGK